MLGSRFLGDPIAGGMPRWKFVSNRFLTGVENAAFGLHLSEYHTGLRAYSRRLLETIPYHLNSNDFVFDQELIAQVVAVGGLGVDEIAVPTRYFDEASSVGFRRSVVYGLSTLRVVARYLLHRTGIRRSRQAAPSVAVARARHRLRCATCGAGSGASALGLAISAVALALVFRTVDVAAAWQTLKTAQPAVDRDPARRSSSRTCSCAPCAGACCSSPLAQVPTGTTLASLLVGYLANNMLPARLGEVVRAHDLGQRGRRSRGPRSSAPSSIERVVDTFVVVAIASVAILVLSVRGIVASAVLAGLAVTALLVVVVAAGIAAHRLPGRGPRRRVPRPLAAGPGVARAPARGARRRQQRARRGRSRSRSRSRPGRARCSRSPRPPRRSGVEPTLGQAALLAAGINLATAIPAGPGYVGTFELAVITIATAVGIDRDAAFAFALLVHVATLLVTSVGGAIVLVFASRARRIDVDALADGRRARRGPLRTAEGDEPSGARTSRSPEAAAASERPRRCRGLSGRGRVRAYWAGAGFARSLRLVSEYWSPCPW